ncbi:Hypothetical protein LROSL1_1179 [Furfurilactobacillus rossiae]|uniref:hypothetical protein n=1 Tax=Furfurilactobacillus rossiae TaxID=231049 RepID=UPI0015BC6236|nr:hypothetical protein [Furfurilactobacillus rossiae]QLE63996.1 Hypothetical protein LROSL1_1179 [Furfurilactobacillus rossiae]
MELNIKSEELQLHLQSDRELNFEEVFRAYQLVTGNDDNLTIDGETVVDGDDGQENTTAVEESPVSKKQDSLTGNWKFTPFRERPRVKADIECPICGETYTDEVPEGFRFVRCRKCDKKLFLSAATGVWGVADEKGFIYRANTLYRDRRDNQDDYAQMFDDKKADDGRPSNMNTIPEITDWLDQRHIDHTGIKLKGDLMELVNKLNV